MGSIRLSTAIDLCNTIDPIITKLQTFTRLSALLGELPEPEKSQRCVAIMEIASGYLCELGATVDAFSASLPKGPVAAPPESEVSWP